MRTAHLAAVTLVGALTFDHPAGLVPLLLLSWLLWRGYLGPVGRIVAVGVRGIVLVDSAFLFASGRFLPGFAVAFLLLGPVLLRRISISGMSRE